MLTLTEAHLHSSHHRREIEASTLAGCFYCLAIYPAGQVIDWIDGGQTACCPRCGVDSVLGDKIGVAIKRPFLEKMQARWFADARPMKTTG